MNVPENVQQLVLQAENVHEYDSWHDLVKDLLAEAKQVLARKQRALLFHRAVWNKEREFQHFAVFRRNKRLGYRTFDNLIHTITGSTSRRNLDRVDYLIKIAFVLNDNAIRHELVCKLEELGFPYQVTSILTKYIPMH